MPAKQLIADIGRAIIRKRSYKRQLQTLTPQVPSCLEVHDTLGRREPLRSKS